jgi:hypothetical protein
MDPRRNVLDDGWRFRPALPTFAAWVEVVCLLGRALPRGWRCGDRFRVYGGNAGGKAGLTRQRTSTGAAKPRYRGPHHFPPGGEGQGPDLEKLVRRASTTRLSR